MNKLIIFACLFVAITSLCTTVGNVTKADDCKSKTLDESEKSSGDACCYFTYVKKEGDKTPYHACLVIKKAEVAQNVDAGKKAYEKYSIDCTSNWLSLSLYLVALIFMI